MELQTEQIAKFSFNTSAIQEIRNFVLTANQTISVAESVTSGLIQTAMATAKDASKFYQGGITAYNLGQKYRHLLVEPIHADSCDSVSEKVANEMAANVCAMFRSDWGIGITGYAVPVTESDQKLFAFYAIAHKGKIQLNNKIYAENNEALEVQLFFVNSVLKGFASYIKQNKQIA